jgi:hypothetical protein
MAKAEKSADELRALLIAEAISHPICPRSIDVVIRRDLAHDWTAQIVSPDPLVNADCARWIGEIVQRLRRDYCLNDRGMACRQNVF